MSEGDSCESGDPFAAGSSSSDLTLGIVSYLNVQPIIWAIEKGLVGNNVQVVPEVPRRLAENLSKGAYHTGIVPVFEYFRRPGFYTYLQAPGIAARGEVYSVVLYASEPMERLSTVYLDASSLTSVHLFKVLAAEKGLDLTFLDTGEHRVPHPLPADTGWVVIGDPAIAEVGRHPYSVDLGLAWQELTGLPFVFAAWLVPQNVHRDGMAQLLIQSLAVGLENIEKVAADSSVRFGVTPEFALRYFTNYIQYHLGDEELAGWNEFGRLCHKHGLIPELPDIRPYRES